MKRLVVIGAGISGLSAAWAAERRAEELGLDIEVLVLERDPMAGGKVKTIRRDGWSIEGGPTGYLDNEPALSELVQSLHLDSRPANEAAARRFVVRKGRPAEIKTSPIAFMKSGILGPLGLLRVCREPFIPRRKDESDESIWDFAARRIGKQMADRMIAPMMLGIFAGDAKRLSLNGAFPRLAEIEAEHGSLIRGMIALRKKKKGANTAGPAGPGGALTSFDEGLALLPQTLAQKLRVRTNARVCHLKPADAESWRVSIEGDSEAIPADAVILSGEPWAMAPLLESAAPAASQILAQIECPPVIVIGLGYGPEALSKVPEGFGVLIPRGEGYRILGSLWDTHLFPRRSPEGKLLIRVMLGGQVDPKVIDLSDTELMETVQGDLHRLFGLDTKPELCEIVRWPRAIPQYDVGHPQRVLEVEEAIAKHPGLSLAGNALHGVAFAKSAALGLKRGREAIDALL